MDVVVPSEVILQETDVVQGPVQILGGVPSGDPGPFRVHRLGLLNDLVVVHGRAFVRIDRVPSFPFGRYRAVEASRFATAGDEKDHLGPSYAEFATVCKFSVGGGPRIEPDEGHVATSVARF